MRFQQQFKFRRLLRRWGLGLLTLVVFTWVGYAQPAYSQLTSLNTNPTAPVVINGRKVLDVQGGGNVSAADRAQSINQRLHTELKLSQLSEVEVVVEEDGPVYLQSKQSGNTLATVTDVDLSTPSYPLSRQAQQWAELLEQSLQQGQWELGPA